MSVSTAQSNWEGTLKEGKGTMKSGSGSFEGPFTFASRFEGADGATPEELIGAAHSGCYSMFLSALLSNDGHTPKSITTDAKVHLGEVDGAPTITKIELNCVAEIPGLDEAAFKEKAEAAKKDCPVSKALAGPEITLTATLKS
ncbi:MAG TPA: OsmC family peroxiredoxin [Opitutales bacterium]|nr:OsmC family peroxiredoxin [Opitutales bacterium]